MSRPVVSSQNFLLNWAPVFGVLQHAGVDTAGAAAQPGPAGAVPGGGAARLAEGGGEAEGGAGPGGQAEGEGEEGRRTADRRRAQQGLGGRRIPGTIFRAVARFTR